jgi:hypothetical protein
VALKKKRRKEKTAGRPESVCPPFSLKKSSHAFCYPVSGRKGVYGNLQIKNVMLFLRYRDALHGMEISILAESYPGAGGN